MLLYIRTLHDMRTPRPASLKDTRVKKRGGICKIYIISFFFLQFLVWYAGGTSVEEPEFAEPIENITVPAGREVRLACQVKNLGQHKVRAFLNLIMIWETFFYILEDHPPN